MPAARRVSGLQRERPSAGKGGTVRILCTGSREWTDEDLIRDVLDSLAARYLCFGEKRDSMVIVHGACPKGADAIVAQVARELGYEVEPHPADVKRHGSPRAFYIRNHEMVEAGAALCLAFWCPGRCSTEKNAMDKAESRGTGDTFTRAVMAGIPVRIYAEGKQ